jgi:hypothetical protein
VAKRCFLRSLSYWSDKTLESSMSVRSIAIHDCHQTTRSHTSFFKYG